MKFFLITALFLISVSCNPWIFSIIGQWNPINIDPNCYDNCCCPLGIISVTADPTNSSQVIATPTSWPDNAVCAALGRTIGASVILPLPSVIEAGSTPIHDICNLQGECFWSDFSNVTKPAPTVGHILIIDDTEIGSDFSICGINMIKSILQ